MRPFDFGLRGSCDSGIIMVPKLKAITVKKRNSCQPGRKKCLSQGSTDGLSGPDSYSSSFKVTNFNSTIFKHLH